IPGPRSSSLNKSRELLAVVERHCAVSARCLYQLSRQLFERNTVAQDAAYTRRLNLSCVSAPG
ncbi:MAG: hypothetical protein ABSH16_08590, partial [Sedimentisphaerales bacterium]